MTPEVSCIIPTRDRAPLVGDAIQSALDQTAGDIEVIVVDDGSTDDTPSALARFGGQILIVPTAGVGPGGARNAGLAVARGTFIALLDSDDVWHSGKVAAQLDVMRRRPDLGFTYTDYTVSEPVPKGGWAVVQTRRHDDEPTLGRLLERNFIGTLTVVVRREVAHEVGGFRPSLRRGSDYDFLLRVAARCPFVRVPMVLADHRWHRESLTGASRRQNAAAYLEVIKSLAASDPWLIDRGGADVHELLARGEERLAALPTEEASGRWS